MSYANAANGGYDNLRAITGTNGDKSGVPRTNPVHAAPICSPDVPQASNHHSKAKRVDLGGRWKLARWEWKNAVCEDRNLSDAAKLLACRLCDRFAHHETAFCNPTVQTLADALGKSVRSVQTALAELRGAQWIVIQYAKGRGKSSEISFLSGHGKAALIVSEKVKSLPTVGTEGVQKSAPLTMTDDRRRVQTSVKKGASGGTPFFKKEKDNQTTRKSGGDEPPEPPAYTGILFKIDRGSHNEASLNGYLTDGWGVDLTQLDRRHGDGWAVPCKVPPRDDDRTERVIFGRWVKRAIFEMEERANA